MPIKNYTTKVEAVKTITEIQTLLVRFGAKNISIDFEGKTPVCLTFLAEINGEFVNYRLPSNHYGVLQAMKKNSDVPPRLRTEEQARRVSWRITKDWVAAQLAIVEANQATMSEVFLPYLVTPSGQTLYELLNERGLKLLAGDR